MDGIENIARLLEKSTILFERHFSVPPERLWQSIATQEGLSQWFMPTSFPIGLGGRFDFEDGWAGTVTRVEPGRCIQFTPDESEAAYLRFEIEPISGGCQFKLSDKMGAAADPATIFPSDTPEHLVYQPGGVGTHWSGVMGGYHGFVDALESHVSGNPIESSMDDLSRKYMAVLDKWHD